MSDKVRCAFCDTEYPSFDIGAHLTSCGNKTEQCPNCEKFVRRAVFAYHYENDCAPDPDIPTPQNEKPPMVTVKCPDCKQNCLQSDYKTHRRFCLQNPNKHKNNEETSTNDNSYEDSDSRGQPNDFYENVGIPCEWCFQSIPIENYQRHAEACRDEEHRKLLEKHHAREEASAIDISHTDSKPVRTTNSRRSTVRVKTPSATATNQCKFCKKIMSAEGLSYHELICVKNPKRNKN